jgi:hypothetical protein
MEGLPTFFLDFPLMRDHLPFLFWRREKKEKNEK